MKTSDFNVPTEGDATVQLQAALDAAAGGLLPGPVLQRLVMPNGREPGLRVKLEPETIALDFWKPFLRALGRRLASVGGAAEIRAFLDGEFEDVYDWLEWEYPAIDANQARAGWAWMLAQHAAWQERERELAHAQREDLRWEVPLATFEHGPWRVVALRDSYELWEEGNALRHCAPTYANHCRRGRDSWKWLGPMRWPARRPLAKRRHARGWHPSR